MDGNDDLRRLIPQPPPPRPASRDAAIGLALSRFDGHAGPGEPPEAMAAPTRAASPAAWRLRWGPIAAFASVLIVALFSIQIALRTPGGPWAEAGRPSPAAQRPGPAIRPSVQDAGKPDVACTGADCGNGEMRERVTSTAAASSARDLGRPAASTEGRVDEAAPVVRATQDLDFASVASAERPVASPPAPAPPPPAPQAKGAAAAPLRAGNEGRMAAGAARRSAPGARESAAAAAAGAGEVRTEGQIMVTGSRVATPERRRGDWNTCTVDDPERSQSGCGALLGTEGKAAAALSAGLERAWQRDWRGAIESFDRAIALQPRFAMAWLNRGLAHRHLGELERAEQDLDRAVRYAPRAARAYYNRSLIRQLRGNERGARADAERAQTLDPSYGRAAQAERR